MCASVQLESTLIVLYEGNSVTRGAICTSKFVICALSVNELEGWARRSSAALISTLALSFGAVATAPVLAADNETTVTQTDVSWQIAGGANCSQLPPGEVISGQGTVTNRIISHTGSDGLTTVKWYQIAIGSAVDTSGNSYRWVYNNHENLVNSQANLKLFTGTMTDSFKLVGGPFAFANGFSADVTDDLGNLGGIFVAVPTSVKGDPFAFPSGPGRCDPI